jgi:hypothetical protein
MERPEAPIPEAVQKNRNNAWHMSYSLDKYIGLTTFSSNPKYYYVYGFFLPPSYSYMLYIPLNHCDRKLSLPTPVQILEIKAKHFGFFVPGSLYAERKDPRATPRIL